MERYPLTRPTRRHSARERTRNDTGMDPLFTAVVIQILLCAILVLGGYLLSQSGTKLYETARQTFSDLIGKPLSEQIQSDVISQFESKLVWLQEQIEALMPGREDREIERYGEARQVAALGQGGLFDGVLSSGNEQAKEPPDGNLLGPYFVTTPLCLPVYGTVSSGYGYRYHPITQQSDFHTGLDIAAAKDSPIFAVLPGTVKEVGESSIYGNYIILEHADGFETFYAHCNRIIAKEGIKIKQGDRIAKVGTTGISTGYHLHFEIRAQGYRLDPMWALADLLDDDD